MPTTTSTHALSSLAANLCQPVNADLLPSNANLLAALATGNQKIYNSLYVT